MHIHGDFPGGNIEIAGTRGDRVWLRPSLRDTAGRWFYWAFCAEGAAGRTVTFDFSDNLVGYFGPAVSRDRDEWRWCGEQSLLPGQSGFSYTFGEGEDRVYFAHHMLYPFGRVEGFSKDTGVPIRPLLPGEGGESAPLLEFGSGEKLILLIARHHCCESTGSYVLEGAARRLFAGLPEGHRVALVPFADYGGALRGDQGKNRIPHDHNRDYSSAPLYPEVRAIQALAARGPLAFAFDFHSPWHCGGRNDAVFFPLNGHNLEGQAAFSALLAEECAGLSFGYRRGSDLAPGEEWNTNLPTMCAEHFAAFPGVDLSMTLETAYFGTPQTPNSQSGLLRLGEAFAAALCRYIRER